MTSVAELEIIPISALNQYAYCPRRCYLMHVERQFADNVHTCVAPMSMSGLIRYCTKSSRVFVLNLPCQFGPIS